MKLVLLKFTYILSLSSVFLSFSQTYKVDENKIYYWFSNWEQQYIEQYTYANGGNKETNLLELSFPSLENIAQYNKTYNANNDIILNVYQTWNGVSWENDYQIVYEYDVSNNLISKTKQAYDSSSMTFYNDERSLYEYTSGNLTKQTNQLHDGTNWETNEEIEFTYTNGLVTFELYSNNFYGDWREEERITKTYDANNLLIEVYTEIYEETGIGIWTWEPLEKSTFTYSGTFATEIVSQLWELSSWENFFRILNTYDSNNNLTVLTHQSYASGWNNVYKEEKSYSITSTLSTNSFINKPIKTFPNPALDVINISSLFNIDKVEIYNVLGKKVQSVLNAKQLNVGNLQSGIYILKMSADKKIISKKIVKK